MIVLNSQYFTFSWPKILLLGFVLVSATLTLSPLPSGAQSSSPNTPERWGNTEDGLNRLSVRQILAQGRVKERVDELRRASLTGDPYASLLLGMAFLGATRGEIDRLFGEMDRRGSLQMLELACSGKVERGCVELAERLYGGNGIPVDKNRARTIIEGACTVGNPRACYEWGHFYSGESTYSEKDYARAHALWERACSMGVAEGCTTMAMQFEFGQDHPSLQIQPDLAQARAYNQLACDLGDGSGCDRAAMNSSQTRRVQEDREAAVRAQEQMEQRAREEQARATQVAAARQTRLRELTRDSRRPRFMDNQANSCLSDNGAACWALGLAYDAYRDESIRVVRMDRRRAFGLYTAACSSDNIRSDYKSMACSAEAESRRKYGPP